MKAPVKPIAKTAPSDLKVADSELPISANEKQYEVKKTLRTGQLTIADIPIPCAVLEDETRLLSQRGMFVGLGRHKNPSKGQASIDDRPAFLAAKNLDAHIPDKLREMWTPIQYYSQGGYKGNIAFGYRAEILPLVCGVFVDAMEAGDLLPAQEHIAKRAKVLMRGLATVGIIALVDEATGWQEQRDRDSLNKMLEAYVLPEYLPYTQRFPKEFYEHIYRLRGWEYDPNNAARPKYIGKLTNELVYKRLPTGVLEELRSKNPKNAAGNRLHKHHQFLTVDIGHPHLEKHFAVLLALLRGSTTWNGFTRLFHRALPAPNGQVELELGLDDE